MVLYRIIPHVEPKLSSGDSNTPSGKATVSFKSRPSFQRRSFVDISLVFVTCQLVC